MGLDQLGDLTVGTLVLREAGVESHRSSLAPRGHNIRTDPMHHMVNKALTCWVAANLISGHLVHAGNSQIRYPPQQQQSNGLIQL